MAASAARAAAASSTVSASTSAPAASVAPSRPSVSTLARAAAGVASSSAAERANSWFGPPSPSPTTVTVHSPPERTTAGADTGFPVARTSSATATIVLAASRASPRTLEESTSGS